MGRNKTVTALKEIVRKTLLLLFFLQLFYIVLLKWVNPPITLTQLNSWISGNGLNKKFISLHDISPPARLAVIAAEDQLFPDHNGFDVKSIQKALEYNTTNKAARIRGASTISQQVAKNVFLWQGRSWWRKGLEAYFTFMIELIWGKERILEIYLNVAEMGTGIFGIEAASQTYFKKSASRLTSTEASQLAAVLPNPKKYTIKPLSPYIAKRQIWILKQMQNLQGDKDIELFLKQPPNTSH